MEIVTQRSAAPSKRPLRRVNESILSVLGTVTIAQLTEETPEPALVELKGMERLAVTG